MGKIIILGTAHGENVSGKCSPDKSLMEYKYSREIISQLKEELEDMGYAVKVDITEDKVPAKQVEELSQRAKIVNAICAQYGKDNCIYVSIHVNAAPPDDGKWHQSGGWCAYTTHGQTKSDILANSLYKAAAVCLKDYKSIVESGTKTGAYGDKQRYIRTDYTDGDCDQEAGYYVLRKTACAAVLTENLFQDNKHDVEYLLSEKGRRAIVEIHKQGIINYLKS